MLATILARPLLVAWGAIIVCLTLPAPAARGQDWNDLNRRYWSADEGGRYVEAEKLAVQLQQIAKQRGDVPRQGTTAIMVARAIEKQGRPGASVPYYQQAFQLITDQQDRSLRTGLLQSLAWACNVAARYEEAERYYRLLLTRIEEEEGPNSGRLVGATCDFANALIRLKRLDEAEQQLDKAQAISQRVAPPDPKLAAGIARAYGLLRSDQYRYEEAERQYRTALAIYQRLKERHYEAVQLEDLSLHYSDQARFQEAEEYALQALTIFRELQLEDSNVLNSLGRALAGQGRLAEAENLFRQALAARQRLLGAEHPKVAVTLSELAGVFVSQFRFTGAAELLEQSLAIEAKAYGEQSENLLVGLGQYSFVLMQQGRLDQARQVGERALKILGPDSLEAGPAYSSLGQIALKQKDLRRAEEYYRRAVEINREFARQKGFHFGKSAAPALQGLGQVYAVSGRHDEAKQQYALALELADQANLAPAERVRIYLHRGENAQAAGWRAEAERDFDAAMNLSEQMRTEFGGSDMQRSAAFAYHTVVFEQMVALQAESGSLDRALNAMERGRNRSLLDQLALQGVDLLDGIPAESRQRLQQELAQANARQTSAERRLEALLNDAKLSATDRQQQARPLQAELQQARNDFVTAEGAIRNASPAYRLVVGENRLPIALDKLREFVARQEGLLLRYLIGDSASFLLVVPSHGEPQLVELRLDEAQAKILGVAPGPLHERKLADVMRSESGAGVLQLLRKSRQPEMEQAMAVKLAVLWEVLTPAAHREALTTGEVKRLFIVPDHDLAMLPFEALVVDQSGGVRYLLDVGPPILYAPSATILYNLAERPAGNRTAGADVLTVGDPAYGGGDAAGARSNAGARYRAVGGTLSRLPYSGTEASWVEQVFVKGGQAVSRLVGAAATEQQVRAKLAGRRVVHFACHGLVDQSHGNLFGALALASSPGGAGGEQDGFLTLAEIYQLDMNQCELTILSACDTNVGPTQVGEGVWALSRGFLVAGSRRVVASNWVVDDKAASSLISYYCGYLAQAQVPDTPPDYAGSLHKARQWVRQQEAWQSPYYWATFVHIGPN